MHAKILEKNHHSELWHILSSIAKWYVINYLSEINIPNKLLNFFVAWYSLFVLKLRLNPNQPNNQYQPDDGDTAVRTVS